MKQEMKKYFLDIFTTRNKKITFIAYFVIPFICNIIIEMCNSRSVAKGFTYAFRNPYSFLVNLCIIFLSLSIGFLMRKRLAYFFTAGMLWIVMGVVNFVIMSKRTTPFSATDFSLLGSIDDTIKKYLNAFEFIMIIVALAIVVVIITAIWKRLPKYAVKINYLRNFVFLGVMAIITFAVVEIGFMIGAVSTKFPNMTIAYRNYGFPYCFSTSFFNKGVAQPDEYSEEGVLEILNRLENTKTVDYSKEKTPNIIFLQLESFFDLNKLENIEFSKEATPIFNKLKEEYPSGYLTVNNVGYGTANTEFEVMTGLNLEDFGPGEFPYTTILTKTTCETTGYILKEYDYATHAIHNNTATFYARNSVFKRLGFDSFTSIEYMNIDEYTPTGWAKDKELTNEIIKSLDSTEEMDYIYTISVQGHGDYPSEVAIEEPEITVISEMEDEGRKNMLEYYANTISEMDTFVGELIDEINNRNEDTVIVIYGDHLPSLDIDEEELVNRDLYQTEYIVWSNFDLDMPDKDIETYQLSSRVLEYLNIDGGLINKFHQVYKKDSNYLEKLHLLTFDILYGNMFTFDGVNPYVATDMKLGTYDITITGVQQAKNKDVTNVGIVLEPDESEDSDIGEKVINPYDIAKDYYLVAGNYFTNYSKITVNGIEVDTHFVNEHLLLINAPDISSLDSLVVNQMSGDLLLSSSGEYTYFNITNSPDGILDTE